MADNPTKKTGKMSAIFSNPDIQRLLAGFGTELDPEGIGGMLGRPTMQALEAKGAAAEGQRQHEMMTALIEALGGRAQKIKVGEKGDITLEGPEEPDFKTLDQEKAGLQMGALHQMQRAGQQRGLSFGGGLGSLDDLAHSIISDIFKRRR